MSVHGGPDNITNGLVMHLDAANTDSYPRSGNTWFDISTNRNNGTLLNSPTFNSDGNGCFNFSSASPGANVNCTGFTFNNPNLTFNCWFKVNNAGSGYRHFISKELTCKYRTNNNNRSIELLYSTTGASWTGFINTPDLIFSDTWYNVVATVQSNGPVAMYLNGRLVSSGNISGTLATNSAVINVGSWDSAGFDPFNGRIAIAQVYNRALSNIEVLQNFNAYRGRFQL